jgi:hypothetical protein
VGAARREEIIQVLDCDIGARPKAAPGVEALLPHVRNAQRSAGAVIVDFDENAARILEAFVDAERLCCPGIGWEIQREPGLKLLITADERQLAAIESLWKHE